MHESSKTKMPDSQAPQIFEQMKTGVEIPQEPGFIEYWEVRAENESEDARVLKIVKDLTRVVLRGEEGDAEYTVREPALQARFWYRSLGPLNPLVDVEHDMVTAAEMMYGKELANPEESAKLQLDTAYILSELAHATGNESTRHQSLRLALGEVHDIKNDEMFNERPASYRLQTLVLENDILHDAIRLRSLGSLGPKEAPTTEAYRQYEQQFTQQELAAIAEFGKQVHAGITNENFGVLFEWYFILAERFDAWSNEEIDIKAVRGATSRENAEWRGEWDTKPLEFSGNHDAVVTTARKEGQTQVDRYQLKAVKNDRRYHPRIKVIDFQEALQERFGSIDNATKQLVKNLVKIQTQYREAFI